MLIPRRRRFMLGIDCNYLLEMERRGHRWYANGCQTDPLVLLREAGAAHMRIRVFTGLEGESGIRYACETAMKAQKRGIVPYISLFGSDQWASAINQPVVESWKDTTIAQRADLLRRHARDAVAAFGRAGVKSHLYQIGNEVDYGFCGVYTREILREDPPTMRVRIWPDEARLLKAFADGIREGDPRAKVVLHIAHWFNPKFAIGFFQTMKEFGVEFDYLGASYYPSSGIPMEHFGISNTLVELGAFVDELTAALDKPLVFCEYGYPCQPAFSGAFTRWNTPVSGFPLTEEGQLNWVSSFLHWCSAHPMVAGAFYWSPEYYSHDDWSAFAFFDENGAARPVVGAFRECAGSMGTSVGKKLGKLLTAAGRWLRQPSAATLPRAPKT